MEDQNNFLEFLRNLLKDQPYVALAYMTGVVHIKNYHNNLKDLQRAIQKDTLSDL